MSMKWLFLGLGASLAVAGIVGSIAAVRSLIAENHSDDIDGGVVKRYWNDAPKTIESTEIVKFHCESSLFAVCDVEELGNCVYTLDAEVRDGDVCVSYEWYDRLGKGERGSYTADADFMACLHQIITEYNLAQHNGYYHSVSGLPDMYGDILNVDYASGETIRVYDNQSGFLPFDAIKALVARFIPQDKSKTESYAKEET